MTLIPNGGGTEAPPSSGSGTVDTGGTGGGTSGETTTTTTTSTQIQADSTAVVNPTILRPSLPVGKKPGHLLLCLTACRYRLAQVSISEGWTQIASWEAENYPKVVLFGRFSTDTDSAPVVIWTNVLTGEQGSPCLAVVATFSGFQSGLSVGSLLDVSNTSTITSASSAAGGGAITTTGSRRLVLSISARMDDVGSFESLATTTENWVKLGTVRTNLGLDMALHWSYWLQPTAGQTNAKSYPLIQAENASSLGVQVALSTGSLNVVVGQAEEIEEPLEASSTSLVSLSLADDMPKLGAELAFGHLFGSSSYRWKDVTRYLEQFSVSRGRKHELDPFPTGSAQITFANHDRRFEPEYAGSPYYPNILPLTPVRIIATWNGTSYPIFNGLVESWPPRWNMSLSDVTVPCVDLFEVLSNSKVKLPTPPELTGKRIRRVLAAIGYRGEVDINLGMSVVKGEIVEGTPLDIIQAAIRAEQGRFFISKNGSATFHSRRHEYVKRWNSATDQWRTEAELVFTDQPDGIKCPYVDIDLHYAKTEIRNSVLVNNGDDEILKQNLTSVGQYGVRSLDVNAPLASKVEMHSLGEELLAKYSDPHVRINSITVDPRIDPDLLWPIVLSMEIGDTITVERHPGPGDPIRKTCYVEGIQHTLQQRNGAYRWTVTIFTSPWTYHAPFVLDIAKLGTTTELVY